YENVSAIGAVVANAWQHIVVTRTAAARTIRFYVNGALKATGTYSTAPAAGTRPISIGRADSGVQYVNGRLDEVAIYTTALSAAQVSAHYALRTSVLTPATAALQLSATDPDGDSLTFGATGLPPGLAVDPATGLVSGTFASGGGTYHVTATASDGTLSSS